MIWYTWSIPNNLLKDTILEMKSSYCKHHSTHFHHARCCLHSRQRWLSVLFRVLCSLFVLSIYTFFSCFMSNFMNCPSFSCVMYGILLLKTSYELFILSILFLMHAQNYEYYFLYTRNPYESSYNLRVMIFYSSSHPLTILEFDSITIEYSSVWFSPLNR